MSLYELLEQRYTELLQNSPSVIRSNIRIWILNGVWGIVILFFTILLFLSFYESGIISVLQEGDHTLQDKKNIKASVKLIMPILRVFSICVIIILVIIRRQAKKIKKRNQHITAQRNLIETMLREIERKEIEA